jgi:hypothetical protein
MVLEEVTVSSATRYLEVKSGYMNRAHNPKEIAEVARLLLKHHPEKLRFDTLVGTGLSGAIVIPPLARSLRKKFLLIRKDGDSSHSSYPAEGVLGRRWLFVDDFVSSGSTFRKVIAGVNTCVHDIGRYRYPGFTSELVGAFQYSDGFDSNASLYSAKVVGKDYEWTSEQTRERRVRESLCTGCEDGCGGCSEQCHDCWYYKTRCTCKTYTRSYARGATTFNSGDTLSFAPTTITIN